MPIKIMDVDTTLTPPTWADRVRDDEKIAIGMAVTYALRLIRQLPESDERRQDETRMLTVLNTLKIETIRPTATGERSFRTVREMLDAKAEAAEEAAIWNWAQKREK